MADICKGYKIKFEQFENSIDYRFQRHKKVFMIKLWRAVKKKIILCPFYVLFIYIMFDSCGL